MNLGQLLGGAGVVASGMRRAEEAERVARQNQLAIEEQNRLRAMRDAASQQGIASRMAGIAPPTWEFTPGQAYEAPQPAAPSQQPAPPSGVQVTPVAPPAVEARPLGATPGGFATDASAGERKSIMDRLAASRRELDQLRGPWYLPTPAANRNRIAQLEQEIVGLQREYQQRVVPAARAEYARVNPQYQYPEQAAAPAAPPASAAPAAVDMPRLYAAVEQVESGGIPTAVSPKGARGPMQTMPGTLRDPGYGVRPAQDTSVEEMRRVGQDYLDAMLRKYNGNLDHALVAYNWGPRNADKWIAGGADPAKLPKETREYVPKVKAALGGAPAAAAPAAPVAAPGASPAKVADAVVKAAQPPAPAKDGTMYGPRAVDATANNPQIQQVLTQRQALVDQIKIMEQYGFGMQAMELVPQIRAIDLGLARAQADQGIYEGTTTGNFSRAMSMLSYFRGMPHQVLDRGDRTYDLYIGGKVARTGMGVEDLADLIRSNVDEDYRTQKAALAGKRAEQMMKIEEIVAKATAEGAVDIQTALIRAQSELMQQQLINNKDDLKFDTASGRWAVRQNGRWMVIDPSATETVRGTTVPALVARPIAGLR